MRQQGTSLLQSSLSSLRARSQIQGSLPVEVLREARLWTNVTLIAAVLKNLARIAPVETP